MINNRLFKKINSVFWALLTWLPLVIFILAGAIRKFDIQLDDQYAISQFFDQFYKGAINVLSNFGGDFWYNPISDVFWNLNDNILDTVGSGVFNTVLIDMCCWACWVQVWRLITYVFMWFIDLLTSLFDYLSFDKRGDN